MDPLFDPIPEALSIDILMPVRKISIARKPTASPRPVKRGTERGDMAAFAPLPAPWLRQAGKLFDLLARGAQARKTSTLIGLERKQGVLVTRSVPEPSLAFELLKSHGKHWLSLGRIIQ
jgi:hypothetical protein